MASNLKKKLSAGILVVVIWWISECPQSSSCYHCQFHHLLLLQNPEWFAILLPVYPGCPENHC